jgi:hypothetical protein
VAGQRSIQNESFGFCRWRSETDDNNVKEITTSPVTQNETFPRSSFITHLQPVCQLMYKKQLVLIPDA